MRHKNRIKGIFMISTLFFFLLSAGCKQDLKENQDPNENQTALNNEKIVNPEIIVGANQVEAYLDILKGKNIALAGNNTSVIFKDGNSNVHLVDSLLALGINITTGFAPEHGFRGAEDAGAVITDSKDTKTGVSIISLYGKNYKPSTESLKNIELVVFDIQDVGVRFYTYLSTLHYIMEACAENNIPLLVLDRPNPNGHYIDGPILEDSLKSFVGMHPVPIVYGMTIGEYAKMINGEKWLKNGIQCDLTIIPLKNYTHQSTYNLPLRPSPNLPNDKSINLYASLCLFEGTNVSCGRGTEMQFQIFGSPDLPKEKYPFSFTPQPNYGSQNPKNLNEECYGLDLSKTENLNSLNFNWLIDAYNATAHKDQFFIQHKPRSFQIAGTKKLDVPFNRLAGTTKLKEQIENGLTFEEIKATWQNDLDNFKSIRSKYLLY